MLLLFILFLSNLSYNTEEGSVSHMEEACKMLIMCGTEMVIKTKKVSADEFFFKMILIHYFQISNILVFICNKYALKFTIL